MGAREFPRLEIEEALARLESMSFFMTAVIEGASRDELLFSPGNRGEFSLTEQACHLRDLEREGYLVRARRMLSETTPQLSGFEGDRIAAERDYRSQDARSAVRDFAAARAELVAIFRAAALADFERDALFEGRRITLAGLLSMVAEHDRGHREEIQEILDVLEAP
jgi:hypothetical protein